MLDEINDDTDKASEALQAVTKKTKELIEQSGASAERLLPLRTHASRFWIMMMLTRSVRARGAGGMKNFVVIIVLVLVLLLLTYLVIMT